MTKTIFLTASPQVRAVCLPRLISGFEAEVNDDQKEVRVLAVRTSAKVTEHDVWLVGRDTGRRYGRSNLPVWEVRREKDWP